MITQFEQTAAEQPSCGSSTVGGARTGRQVEPSLGWSLRNTDGFAVEWQLFEPAAAPGDERRP